MDYNGITGSFNVNSLNRIVNSFNQTVHTTIPDKKTQVVQWLSSLEPQKRHQHLRENRLEGVGKWIFQTSEFRTWHIAEDGSSRSVLFCHGDPGVGKTHLSSLVIDHFYGSGQDVTVAGLYCDYLDKREQTTSNMLGVMLKQLVGDGMIPEEIGEAFEGAKRHFGGVRPEVPELLTMLKTAIAQRQRVVICIDGLDESLAVHRTGLLRALRTIVQESPNTRLFLTGRPFIRSEVERYFPTLDAITVSPTREDTEAFLRMKLDGDPEPDAMDDRLRADIMEIIPETISEIFLLVSLSIETILGETTIHRRREKLKQMSTGQNVGDVYTATLERIRAQEKDRARLGMEAIMWVAHSERPLEPDELRQALGVEIGSRDLNSDNTPSIRTILNCGLGLVTVDSSSSKVRLVHFTLQEHIIANPTLFHSPHSMIAEVCLTYLNFDRIKDISPGLDSLPPTTPFLEYASYHWGAHATRETSPSVISLALKLLDQFEAHVSCTLHFLENFEWEDLFCTDEDQIGFTGLHFAAYLGVLEIMVPLLKIQKWDLNKPDVLGNTALVLAAGEGHDGIVGVLLQQEGVDPNIEDHWGRTPLAWAALGGHQRMVKILLERNDVNPDAGDWNGTTPFSLAAARGYTGIVRMLWERDDVNPDVADENGRTPLSWAAADGHQAIVQLLFERNDVNPDAADKSGRTPLSWASQCWHEGFGKKQLEQNDVDPGAAEKSRRPPPWIAGNGCAEIARMLLERSSVNPNSADQSGRTPFSWAAESGCVGVVRMLLEQGDVDPNRADQSGRTPLSWAAGKGREETARMLLERNDVSPNTADEGGRTPFSWAAGNGHRKTVKMLLERNDVDPHMADERGRTPFSWVSETRFVEIVTMLLQRNDVNPDSADKSGRTPLSWAVERGREETVKMLLERSDVNPDSADKSGRTPLLWAAEKGRGMIIDILLKQRDSHSGTIDESGQTTPLCAARSEHEEIVAVLPERNNINRDDADEIG